MRAQDFSRVMDKCTEDHGCIVLDNTSPTSKIEDSIFWYKAQLTPPPFRMGKEVFWKLDRMCCKSDEDLRLERQEASKSQKMAELSRRRREPIVEIQRHDERGKIIDADEEVELH